MRTEKEIREKMEATVKKYGEAIAADNLKKAHELNGKICAYLWVLGGTEE